MADYMMIHFNDPVIRYEASEYWIQFHVGLFPLGFSGSHCVLLR